MLIWVLTDNRTGGNNQSIAVAEKIATDYVTKKIEYNSLIKLPNLVRGSSLLGVDKTKSDALDAPYPDLLICAGRRLSPVALNVKKKSGGKTFVVNIMNPNLPYRKFDLVLLPKHDATSPLVLEANPNIIETLGSVNRVQKEKMKSESAKWKKELSKLPKPYIGFILGGDTKDTKFPPEAFGKTTKALSDLANKLGGSLLITTSRRTSDECLKAMKANLKCKYYLYDWNDEQTKPEKKRNPLGNPYFAYMGISDYIVVTGDSMSMVSEACSTGRPVYVYMPDVALGKKHKRFCKGMIADGYVKEFDENIHDLENYSYEPLNETQRVVKIIINKMKKK